MNAHEKAVDWALSKGFNMSVTDRWADEWDCEHSTDKAEIMGCINATELPNVYIFSGKDYLMAFSVIDEGIPDETINDYTIPLEPKWRADALAEFERAIYREA